VRVSLDAGVLASAFVAPGSAEEAAYRRALEGEVELVTSPAVLLEFATLLTGRLGWDPVMAEHAVTHVARVAAAVLPQAEPTR
jgi:predicted nucleic acid-binding protein